MRTEWAGLYDVAETFHSSSTSVAGTSLGVVQLWKQRTYLCGSPCPLPVASSPALVILCHRAHSWVSTT